MGMIVMTLCLVEIMMAFGIVYPPPLDDNVIEIVQRSFDMITVCLVGAVYTLFKLNHE
jgi:hypothetical protein